MRRRQRRTGLDRFILLLNVLLLLFLVLAYLAGMISPNTCWPLAFIGLAYPVLLSGVLIFSIYWLIRRRWFLFLNAAMILIRPDLIAGTISLQNPPEATTGFKLMSYNVRLFNRYQWSENRNASEQIWKLIQEEQPDVLCFQEFYADGTEDHRRKDALDKTGPVHIYMENYAAMSSSSKNWGLATFSVYPIVGSGKITFPDSPSALVIYTDLAMNQDTVRVYNLHLQSIHLGTEDYAVLDDLMEVQQPIDVQRGRAVLSRMKQGIVKRARQAEILADHISRSPHPTIVCGDFNDVPTSYAYQTISHGMKDAFSKSGSGMGATYVRVPFFRIDHVLFGKEFESLSHEVHSEQFSDHLAVSAVLRRR